MRKSFTWIMMSFVLLLVTTACSSNQSTDKAAANSEKSVELTISAAASLKEALDEIQHTYQAEDPEVKLKFNFGGSGSLQQQIFQGAPVDLFFSAAEDKFAQLVEEGSIAKDDGVDLLRNELVLIVPKKEPSSVNSFQDLTKSELNKIAMGIPESVPAGKYTKESFEKMGIWTEVESKMVFAKDVRRVLSYVETGNVSAGIVYKTDALITDNVTVVATADSNTHTPIVYPVGILKASEHYEEAKDFYNYLQSEDALKVFRDYGFTTE